MREKRSIVRSETDGGDADGWGDLDYNNIECEWHYSVGLCVLIWVDLGLI